MRLWKVKMTRSKADSIRFSTSVFGRGSHTPKLTRAVKLMASSPAHVKEIIEKDWSQYGWKIVSIEE